MQGTPVQGKSHLDLVTVLTVHCSFKALIMNYYILDQHKHNVWPAIYLRAFTFLDTKGLSSHLEGIDTTWMQCNLHDIHMQFELTQVTRQFFLQQLAWVVMCMRLLLVTCKSLSKFENLTSKCIHQSVNKPGLSLINFHSS